jgi:hypothetical protein
MYTPRRRCVRQHVCWYLRAVSHHPVQHTICVCRLDKLAAQPEVFRP